MSLLKEARWYRTEGDVELPKPFGYEDPDSVRATAVARCASEYKSSKIWGTKPYKDCVKKAGSKSDAVAANNKVLLQKQQEQLEIDREKKAQQDIVLGRQTAVVEAVKQAGKAENTNALILMGGFVGLALIVAIAVKQITKA